MVKFYSVCRDNREIRWWSFTVNGVSIVEMLCVMWGLLCCLQECWRRASHCRVFLGGRLFSQLMPFAQQGNIWCCLLFRDIPGALVEVHIYFMKEIFQCWAKTSFLFMYSLNHAGACPATDISDDAGFSWNHFQRIFQSWTFYAYYVSKYFYNRKMLTLLFITQRFFSKFKVVKTSIIIACSSYLCDMPLFLVLGDLILGKIPKWNGDKTMSNECECRMLWENACFLYNAHSFLR